MSDEEGSEGEAPRLEAFREVVDKYSIDLEDPVDSFDDYEAIEELDLSEKDWEALPDDVLEVLPPNLKTLALEKNALTSLPDSFGQNEALPELTELYLRENRLASLPAGLKHLSKLESLYLEDNELTAGGIPDEIAELAGSMLGLCLHRNQLTVSWSAACVDDDGERS
jgi:Leucine-rich repeat (LRR) protein